MMNPLALAAVSVIWYHSAVIAVFGAAIWGPAVIIDKIKSRVAAGGSQPQPQSPASQSLATEAPRPSDGLPELRELS